MSPVVFSKGNLNMAGVNHGKLLTSGYFDDVGIYFKHNSLAVWHEFDNAAGIDIFE